MHLALHYCLFNFLIRSISCDIILRYSYYPYPPAHLTHRRSLPRPASASRSTGPPLVRTLRITARVRRPDLSQCAQRVWRIDDAFPNSPSSRLPTHRRRTLPFARTSSTPPPHNNFTPPHVVVWYSFHLPFPLPSSPTLREATTSPPSHMPTNSPPPHSMLHTLPSVSHLVYTAGG